MILKSKKDTRMQRLTRATPQHLLHEHRLFLSAGVLGPV
jgi:hypothetical protein